MGNVCRGETKPAKQHVESDSINRQCSTENTKVKHGRDPKRNTSGKLNARRRSSITTLFTTKNYYVANCLLQGLKRRREVNDLRSLNSILLKFGKVEKGLTKAREFFEELEVDGMHAIPAPSIQAACEKLSVEFRLDVLKELKVYEKTMVTFKEYIVTLALFYLIQKEENNKTDPSTVPKPPTEFEASIDMVVDSFNFFDSNGDGVLEKAEVMSIFSASGSDGSKKTGQISSKRFEEMDWDRDEKINFPEFLFAFESWIGLDVDEDDDDDKDGYKDVPQNRRMSHDFVRFPNK
mmetsp:Transcript_17966/g.30222  ORF Transcript_17966/g.30222 Transcript_17966/m.30222 type:complete len:293 (+) Transcript_17966:374-1252(+)|eukprot:CAMPEP_0198211958 /NCGR_PEP_ID=MMETSP1445-20131203/25439_1 /TAXON_ID=36898 /ORGANISM="Pyramimonas sp., Strain CCMP2087" /LENGTH=292 /DNA_ID=CAMNT_0043886319 /DNA_START=357 /DNA_END=1235 /DNA_ORIENTATION=-